MRKIQISFFLLYILISCYSLNAIIPYFYGARSLSLGMSSSAFNYDINSIFINPALLSELKIPMAGYQYQSGNLAYKNFYDVLSGLDLERLKNYSTIDSETRKSLTSSLKTLFSSKFGLVGFNSNIPGFAVKRYGFSVSFYNLTIINPDRTNDPGSQGEILTDEMAENLKMIFTGLNYKKYSLAYGVDISRNINIGVAIHYLNGKISVSRKSLTDEIFLQNKSEKDLTSSGWSDPEHKFGKLIADISLNSTIGNSFKLAIIVKNVGDPKIEAGSDTLEVKQRIIAAAAFRPDNRIGIYIDVDLKKRNIYFDKDDIQPVSMGVEKLFSNGKFMVRAGLMSDLTEHYLFGKRANILYGLGFGFNTGKFLVDGAVGLGNDGKVRSLAVSGFYIIR